MCDCSHVRDTDNYLYGTVTNTSVCDVFMMYNIQYGKKYRYYLRINKNNVIMNIAEVFRTQVVTLSLLYYEICRTPLGNL